MRVLLAIVLALAVVPSALASEQHPTQAELEGELVCPTCSTTLDQSNAPIALRMKQFVRTRIAAGDTKSEIKDQLVAQFGKGVLAAPEQKGFDLLAWVLPIVVNHAGILAQVKTVTDRPLRYVINTHQHDDHAGGDFKMLPLAEVIAHRNARANLKDLKRPYYEDTPGTPVGLPRITFTDRLDVHLGGKDVEAYYFGRGHTSGDAIIYFPELKAIHTGDLFLNFRPSPVTGQNAPARPPGVPVYVDYVQGGSFIEWSRTLERALALDFDTIIPGHGPVAARDDLVRFAGDLRTMRTQLTGMIKGGTTRGEIIRILEVDYGWRSTGCPPPPQMTGGCLQYQQVDALIAELKQ